MAKSEMVTVTGFKFCLFFYKKWFLITMVLTSSHYNWFIAVITQKQTGGEETEKDVFINISLILAQLWTFGMSFIKLYVTLSGKFKTILDTVKVFTED